MTNRIDYKSLFDLKFASSKKEYKQFERLILAIDPSGSIQYGQGHIGMAIGGILKVDEEPMLFILETKTINLEKIQVYYKDKLNYALRYILKDITWLARKRPLQVICEKYVEYQNAATKFQEPETYYVVKYLESFCYDQKIDFKSPMATQHKQRFPNKVLQNKGVKTYLLGSKHAQDATRMILYYFMFDYEPPWKGVDKQQLLKNI